MKRGRRKLEIFPLTRPPKRRRTKGQVTIFIIIGILFVAFAGVVIFVASSTTEKEEINNQELDGKTDHVYSLIEGCLEKIVMDGLFIFGVDETSIESYIDSTLGDCIDFSDKFPLLDVVEGDIESEVDLSSDTNFLEVNVDYLLVLKKGEASSEISKFDLKYPLLVNVKLATDSEGKTTAKRIVRSADERLVLEIEPGTEVKDSDGDFIDELSIKIEQIDTTTANWFVYVDYKFEPDGVAFNPPIDIQIQYLEDEILQEFGRSEDTLKIACLDGSPIYTNNPIDMTKNILSGSMDKFC